MVRLVQASANVFADIGVDHPEQTLIRAEVMAYVIEIIKERHLTPKSAAELLGIPQSKVSCLMNGKLSMFSLDHLFELLNTLDRDVEIVIRPKSRGERVATTHVLMEAVA